MSAAGYGHACAPGAELGLWDLDGIDKSDRRWRHDIFERLPLAFVERVAERYRKTFGRSGRTAANSELREQSEIITHRKLRLSGSDSEIRDQAKAYANTCHRLALHLRDPEQQYTELAQYVEKRGITPPRLAASSLTVTQAPPTVTIASITLTVRDEGSTKKNLHSVVGNSNRGNAGGYSLKGAIARMQCARWWRRALRREIGRAIEHQAIRLGLVHRRAGKYLSDASFRRIQQQWRLNEIALSSVAMENEAGDILDLEELVARSNANPRVRRSELMVRMKGTERYATTMGDVGVFLTLTCPSRFHARYSQSGDENPNYQGSSPLESQAYLTGLWARIRSACQRRGFTPYGIRVVEPHHDGTPHWHLLLFMPKEQKKAFVTLCREYALKDSPDEPGAQEKRFTAKDIDWNQGTATGYIAKYISKNIDGYGMDADEDGDEISHSAQRVRGWASLWGIRQFQFFGGPPVRVWRELRRLPEGVYGSKVIEQARQAADAGDWEAYMKVMGGTGCAKQSHPIKLAMLWSDKESVYGEPVGEMVFGVECFGVVVETRFHIWKAVPKVRGEESKQGGLELVHLESCQ